MSSYGPVEGRSVEGARTPRSPHPAPHPKAQPDISPDMEPDISMSGLVSIKSMGYVSSRTLAKSSCPADMSGRQINGLTVQPDIAQTCPATGRPVAHRMKSMGYRSNRTPGHRPDRGGVWGWGCVAPHTRAREGMSVEPEPERSQDP